MEDLPSIEEFEELAGVEKHYNETFREYVQRLSEFIEDSEVDPQPVATIYERSQFSKDESVSDDELDIVEDFLSTLDKVDQDADDQATANFAPTEEEDSFPNRQTSDDFTPVEHNQRQKRIDREDDEAVSFSSLSFSRSSISETFIGILGVIPSAFRETRYHAIKPSEIDIWPFRALLLLITLFAAYNFSTGIGAYPLHIDEAIHLIEVRELVQNGSYSYTPFVHGPLLFYLLRPVLPLFDYSIIVGRFHIAIMAMLMFPAFYYLRRAFSDVSILVAALVMATHPWSIRLVQNIRQDAIATMFILWAWAAYFNYQKASARRWAIGFGASMGLAVATIETAWVALPLFLLPIVGFAWIDIWLTNNIDDVVDTYFPIVEMKGVILSGIAVTVFFYAGWPLSVSGILNSPLTLIEGIEYWTQGASGEPTPAFYWSYMTKYPILLGISALGLISTAVRREVPWSRWVIITYGVIFFIVRSFILTHQSVFNLIFFLPILGLMAGWAFADCWSILEKFDLLESVIEEPAGLEPKSVVTVLLIVLLLSASTAGAAYSGNSVESFDESYFPASSWTGSSPGVLGIVDSKASETGCPVVLSKNDFLWFQAFPTWYLGEHEINWVNKYNETEGRAVILTSKRVPALNEHESKRVPLDEPWKPTMHRQDGMISSWIVYWPREGCRF